ncbi:hypothetical protein [Litoreibacter halocynthiae]|uniref:hypothetical protein n=1 Tax=Litoreibacter halocynthiae TaxID=1242689 RepID=UPI00249282AC|nr:hypothetical protein [Litoreibacter halocynthiae]
MKVHLTDREVLRALSPLDVRAYLNQSGWELTDTWEGRATIHRLIKDSSEYIVKVPVDKDPSDFASVMGSVVHNLSKVEQRSELEVYQTLSHAGSDVISVRSKSADARGTIELADGVELFDQARTLLTAAAKTEGVGPRPSYRGRPTQEVQEYLDGVRLGQTGIGSFILNILSPVSSSIRTPKLDIDDPFERRVVLKLSTALQSAKKALTNALIIQSIDPFEEAIENGVSANFCNALGDMLEENKSVDIQISYSPRRPHPGPLSRIAFDQDAASVFHEVARTFRETKPQLEVLLEATALTIGTNEPQETYDVDFIAFVDGKSRKVRGVFGVDNFDVLSSAVKDNSTVRFRADVHPEGHIWRLENISGVKPARDETARRFDI